MIFPTLKDKPEASGNGPAALAMRQESPPTDNSRTLHPKTPVQKWNTWPAQTLALSHRGCHGLNSSPRSAASAQETDHHGDHAPRTRPCAARGPAAPAARRHPAVGGGG